MRTRSSGTCCSAFSSGWWMRAAKEVALALSVALPAQAADPGLRFTTASSGELVFDTGVLRGTLRAKGKSDGLSGVVHIPTGRPVSYGYGLIGHYRVFSANRRYIPDAWASPSQATLRTDGSVEVHWPASDGRPFEMWAVYRWSAPAVLDVETRVQARSALQGFESFLASYFAEGFLQASAWVKQGKAHFVEAGESEGAWQMFPRDHTAVLLIQDGRWKYRPSPVDWRIRAALNAPLAVRREAGSGLAVALMSPPSDCYALSAPQQRDKHRSLYLSLFGRDLAAGATARARVRMVVGVLQDSVIVKMYRQYTRSLGKAKIGQAEEGKSNRGAASALRQGPPSNRGWSVTSVSAH